MQKVAIVTGAGRGAGRSISIALAREGFGVGLVARSPAELEHVADEIRTRGGQAVIAQADVADERQVDEAVTTIKSRFGRIDVLVNNAGVGIYGALQGFSLDDWRRCLDTNLTGVFLMTRSALPEIRTHRGVIIAIGSGASLRGYAQRSAYAAAKFGLRGFMQSLAEEEPTVKSCIIVPGNILTDFSSRTRLERLASGQNFLEPEDIADAVLFLVRQPGRAWTQEMQVWPFASQDALPSTSDCEGLRAGADLSQSSA